MLDKPDQEWPPAVEIVNEDGASDIVLLCEHASNYIPAEFGGLGLGAHDLGRHIAWDIGAAEVTRGLSKLLDAPALLGTYSRLLIDLNRPLGAEGSIAVHSEDTDIPGNAGLAEEEKARRAALIFSPYHERVAGHLDDRERRGAPTRIVTIHSFTPVFCGVSRPWHAGVLYGRAAGFGEAVLALLRADGVPNAAANVPYAIGRDSDYAVPIHGDDRGLEAVLIEIRQDLISGSAGIEEWTRRLAATLPAGQAELRS